MVRPAVLELALLLTAALTDPVLASATLATFFVVEGVQKRECEATAYCGSTDCLLAAADVGTGDERFVSKVTFFLDDAVRVVVRVVSTVMDEFRLDADRCRRIAAREV